MLKFALLFTFCSSSNWRFILGPKWNYLNVTRQTKPSQTKNCFIYLFEWNWISLLECLYVSERIWRYRSQQVNDISIFSLSSIWILKQSTKRKRFSIANPTYSFYIKNLTKKFTIKSWDKMKLKIFLLSYDNQIEAEIFILF